MTVSGQGQSHEMAALSTREDVYTVFVVGLFG